MEDNMNRQRIESTLCTNCLQSGHKREQCPHPRFLVPARVICPYCGKGHSAAQCKLCNNCFLYGHLESSCRYNCRQCHRRHRLSQCDIGHCCALCFERYHSSSNCWSRQFCWFCRSDDHFISSCPRREEQYCYFCAEHGHLDYTCFHPDNINRIDPTRLK